MKMVPTPAPESSAAREIRTSETNQEAPPCVPSIAMLVFGGWPSAVKATEASPQFPAPSIARTINVWSPSGTFVKVIPAASPGKWTVSRLSSRTSVRATPDTGSAELQLGLKKDAATYPEGRGVKIEISGAVLYAEMSALAS